MSSSRGISCRRARTPPPVEQRARFDPQPERPEDERPVEVDLHRVVDVTCAPAFPNLSSKPGRGSGPLAPEPHRPQDGAGALEVRAAHQHVEVAERREGRVRVRRVGDRGPLQDRVLDPRAAKELIELQELRSIIRHHAIARRCARQEMNRSCGRGEQSFPKAATARPVSFSVRIELERAVSVSSTTSTSRAPARRARRRRRRARSSPDPRRPSRALLHEAASG